MDHLLLLEKSMITCVILSHFQIPYDLEVEVQLPQGFQEAQLAQDQLHILPILDSI